MLRVPTLHIQKAFPMVFICSEKNEKMKRKEKNFLPIFIFHHHFFMLATWIQIVRARPQFPQHSLHTCDEWMGNQRFDTVKC